MARLALLILLDIFMKTTDVLIIGSGIAGASAALKLAQNPQRRILLLTRDALKYMQYVTEVPEEIRVRAYNAVERMLKIG